MKIKISRLLILCFAVVAFIGCYEDKGHYDYKELSTFYVDTAGAKTSYTVLVFDRLEINPKVIYEGDPTNLAYSWVVMDVATNLIPWQSKISEEKNLSEIISAVPGRYYIDFLVTEKSTGRMTSFLYDLRVEATGAGMLVLYQRDGLTDFGLITPTYLIGGTEEDKVSLDIYTFSNPDHPLTGAPVGIGGYKYATTEYISVFTEDDGVRLSPVDYSITHEFKDLFLILPEQRKIMAYCCPMPVALNTERCDPAELLINDDVYYVNYVPAPMGAGANSCYGERSVKKESNIVSLAHINSSSVVFDHKSSRLMQGSVTGSVAYLKDELSESLDMDVLHLARNSSANYYVNMVLKGKGTGNESKRYFYIADINVTFSYIRKWDISSYTGIAQSEVFAFAQRAPVAYYTPGGKIYQIKFDDMSNILGDQAIEVWAGATGETVTAMKFCPHPGRDLGGQDMRDRYLFVGTWNESAQEGKVYTFEVNLSTDGSLVKTPIATYGGFGKIKDFAYKF